MAVYTPISDDMLHDLLRNYDVGAVLSFKGIAEGVENSNYLLKTTSGSYILTIYEKRVNVADLPFFMALMRHLVDGGLPAPLPIAQHNGDVLNTLAGKSAVLISFLDGVSPTLPNLAQCRAIGATLAQMHLALGRFDKTRDNSMGLEAWRGLIDEMRAHQEQGHDVPHLDLIEEEQSFLEPAWDDVCSSCDIPFGIVHADLFPNNTLFLGDQLCGIIDFYFACRDALAYDVAIVINSWCFDDAQVFDDKKAGAILQAYHSVRPLSAAERSHFGVIARRAAQRFLVSRAYDVINTPQDALVTPLDPAEYARILQFHRENEDVFSLL